jgi:4-hydroxy-tetrahydrodipicolinate reductase
VAAARVVVVGARGRMGQALRAQLAAAEATLTLTAAVDRDDDLAAGLDACDVYIDFSSPAATRAAAELAHARRLPAVIGTTGLDAEATRAVDALAEVAPVVVAANYSLGVTLLADLVQRAARAVPGWAAEIVEVHHRHKVDAPSGTALALAEAVRTGHGGSEPLRHGRGGLVGARPAAEIGLHAVRGGDVVGEHTVLLLGDGERLELTHRATDRGVFAHGALVAASWVIGRAPGRYDLRDVLGLR